MKKTLLLLSFALILGTSCKKSATTPSANANGTISATIDGTNVNFNAGVVATLTTASGTSALQIAGANTATTETVSVAIISTSAIVNGTYTVSSTNPNPSAFPAITYSKGSSASNVTAFATDVSGSYPTTVTITSISKTNVQGTFSGTIVSSTNGTTTKAVTSGKFNVTIKQ